MEKSEMAPAVEKPRKEQYHEPLLTKHEPLRNLTGQKYIEKTYAYEIPD